MERGKICIEFAKKLGGPQESTILGTTGKVSCINAAFANGELINALDWDALLAVHAPPFVIPAPLAVSEIISASGKDLILSIALGHEIAKRFQMATPPLFKAVKSGPKEESIVFSPFDGHGSVVFGAAVGAAKMLNLPPEKMASAIGIAGYAGPPSTSRKWTDTVPCRMTKYGPPGFTAEVGVRSAILADMGYYGDTEIFDNEFGYWRFSGFQEWNREIVAADIGKKWYCNEVSYKQYPSCHCMNGMLDIFIQIIEENNLKPDEIEKVEVTPHPLWLNKLWKENKFCISWPISCCLCGL
jgi:2-methylcitrate dehydratase PrpD